MAGVVRRKTQGRREKNDDAGEAAGQSEPDDRRRARCDPAPPGEKSDVDWHSRDHHRSETGRNILLGQGDAAIAAEQETAADDQRREPMCARCLRCAPPARDGVEHHARQKKTRAGHEQRRNRFDGEEDGEISRAPDEVERRERRNNGKFTGPRHATALWHSSKNLPLPLPLILEEERSGRGRGREKEKPNCAVRRSAGRETTAASRRRST